MANAVIYNFELDQGASWSRVITWKEPGTSEAPTSGDPINLTGYNCNFIIRDPVDPDNSLLTLHPSLGDEQGTITLALTAEQTTDLDAEYCDYELELINGEEVTVLLRGQIKVRKSLD